MIANKIIEQVLSFNYFELITSYYQTCINTKAKSFISMCGIVIALKIKLHYNTLLKFCEIIAVAVLTNGSENWTVNIVNERRI